MRTTGQHVDNLGPRKNAADDRRNVGSNIAEQELGLQKKSLGNEFHLEEVTSVVFKNMQSVYVWI